MDFHLIPMKKSRKMPKAGDIFVFQPVKGKYYYGKVIIDSYKSDYDAYQNTIIVYLYNHFSNQIRMPTDNLSKILVAPIMTTKHLWLKGYFEVVGNSPVTEEELKLDCGFECYPTLDFEQEHPYYRNMYGEKIDYVPQHFTLFALATDKGVNYEVCNALGIGQ